MQQTSKWRTLLPYLQQETLLVHNSVIINSSAITSCKEFAVVDECGKDKTTETTKLSDNYAILGNRAC